MVKKQTLRSERWLADASYMIILLSISHIRAERMMSDMSTTWVFRACDAFFTSQCPSLFDISFSTVAFRRLRYSAPAGRLQFTVKGLVGILSV